MKGARFDRSFTECGGDVKYPELRQHELGSIQGLQESV
jgi:hypothetical protein